MKYYKFINSGYIVAVGNGKMGEEITEPEYNQILTVIRNKPDRTATVDYRLREDMTWEPFEVEPPGPNPELNDTEALNIILGENEVDHG